MILFASYARLSRQHNFGHIVLNFYTAMAASPFAKNVLRMFEAHFWIKYIRMLSLDENNHHT